MNITCSIALDALAIVQMLVFVFGRFGKYTKTDAIYYKLILAVTLFLSLDILYLLFLGKTTAFFKAILLAVKSLYFIFNALIVFIWARYVEHMAFSERSGVRLRGHFYSAVFLINTALVVLNLFTGILFHISDVGIMVVTPVGMWVFTALNYTIVALVLVQLIRRRRSVTQNLFLPMIIFPILPGCAEIIQIFYRKISLICAYSVSTLIMYQTSQSALIYSDPLTQLGNRRMLYEFLNTCFNGQKKCTVYGIMIDIDGLKQTNDTYGHTCGDAKILSVTDMIKKSAPRGAVAIRFGGDEFVLVWTSDSKDSIELVKNRLEHNCERINHARPERERAYFSIGAFSCGNRDGLTSDTFLNKIDQAMYEVKKEKKCSKMI